MKLKYLFSLLAVAFISLAAMGQKSSKDSKGERNSKPKNKHYKRPIHHQHKTGSSKSPANGDGGPTIRN